jgi:acyl-CoA thioesterase-1
MMQFKAWTYVFFVAAGLVGMSAQANARTLQIVALGDSLTAGYELAPEEAFPARLETLLKAKGHDIAITNAGVSGDTSADGLARVDWSVPDGTDGVILELGANDALRGLSPDETRRNLDAILKSLKARKIPVLIAGMVAPPNMGPGYAEKFNPIFTDLAKKYDAPIYPFFLDGVTLHPDLQLNDGMHPNSKGTEIMAKKILPLAEAFVNALNK